MKEWSMISCQVYFKIKSAFLYYRYRYFTRGIDALYQGISKYCIARYDSDLQHPIYTPYIYICIYIYIYIYIHLLHVLR